MAHAEAPTQIPLTDLRIVDAAEQRFENMPSTSNWLLNAARIGGSVIAIIAPGVATAEAQTNANAAKGPACPEYNPMSPNQPTKPCIAQLSTPLDNFDVRDCQSRVTAAGGNNFIKSLKLSYNRDHSKVIIDTRLNDPEKWEGYQFFYSCADVTKNALRVQVGNRHKDILGDQRKGFDGEPFNTTKRRESIRIPNGQDGSKVKVRTVSAPTLPNTPHQELDGSISVPGPMKTKMSRTQTRRVS